MFLSSSSHVLLNIQIILEYNPCTSTGETYSRQRAQSEKIPHRFCPINTILPKSYFTTKCLTFFFFYNARINKSILLSAITVRIRPYAIQTRQQIWHQLSLPLPTLAWVTQGSDLSRLWHIFTFKPQLFRLTNPLAKSCHWSFLNTWAKCILSSMQRLLLWSKCSLLTTGFVSILS